MKPAFTELERCLACGGSNLVPLLDLGAQPLANEYHDNSKALPEYPLRLNICQDCFHAQQAVAVDPDLMFRNYLYVSGTSKTLRDYFDWFAGMVVERVGKRSSGTPSVLDIACNDGSQLAAFKKYGWELWGVDPAENLLERSRATGATVVCDYWNERTAKKMGREFNVLIAQNVFAHVADPFAFLSACALVMHEGSKLFIQTSQADMFDEGQFDTIYHEHISFFSAGSLRALAHRAGFVLEDIFITPVHGGSYVFVLSKVGEEKGAQKRLAHEEEKGRTQLSTYHRFAEQAKAAVAELKKTVGAYRAKGVPVVGFGAAAKGNTLLNFGGIKLDYIVDDNPLKHGLHTPGMNIPIDAPTRLGAEEGDIVVVPLAWNFFDEIYRKVKTIRPDKDDVFVTYFPSVKERR